ncbi:MAG: hypothetical protein ABIB97_03150 [Patescibacteria group bacterium]
MKRTAYLGLMLTLVCLIICSGCSDNNPTGVSMDEQSEIVTLEFVASISLDDLILMSENHNLTVEEIRLVIGDITVGYTVGGRSISEIKDEFVQEHDKFLNFLSENCQQDDALAPYQGICHDMKSQSDKGEIEVSIISVQGPVDRVTIESLGAKVEEEVIVLPTDREVSISQMNTGEPEESDEEVRSYWHERWAPYGGQSLIIQAYTYQKFIFNNTSDFTSLRTYEHETQVYDRNFADYTGYWATNMPYGYKDTSFCDNIDNFTVGCSRAELLTTYRWYWTYMSLRRQSSGSALCRIKGQIGHRIFGWCYSTWCIVADATSGTMAYLLLPNYGCCWQY